MMAMIWLSGGKIYSREGSEDSERWEGRSRGQVERSREQEHSALTREQVEELRRYSSRLADAEEFP